MGLIDKLQSRPRVVVIGSILVVLVCGVAAYRSLRGDVRHSEPVDVVFFDESSGQLSRHAANLIPPQPGADGKPSLVRAVMNDNSLSVDHISYLFRYTPEAQAGLADAARQDNTHTFDLILLHEDTGKQVRKPTAGAPWVPAESDEGRRIIAGE